MPMAHAAVSTASSALMATNTPLVCAAEARGGTVTAAAATPSGCDI